MDRRAVARRLTTLEAKLRPDPVILHFEDGNKTPMTIAGTAKSFQRLVSLLQELRDKNEYRRPGTRMQGALFELDLVRRAVRIEGASAGLFSLLQSIARDPVPDKQ